MEGGSNLGKVFDEASIEICEAEKSLDIVDSFGFRPVQDTFDLLWVHAHPLFVDDHPKVFDSGLFKQTLLGFAEKVVLLEALEYFLDDELV